MTNQVHLRGMTWDHSRGYDPMVATSDSYAKMHPGVSIAWEKRSLQAFADRPIEDMANEFDLMVIDHPHVGEVAQSGLLHALDTVGREAEMKVLAAQSVGPSHHSYEFGGHQWALAIDAATPVAAFRPDRLDRAPAAWEDVIELARAGKVGFALIPINALMTFMGLARNLGTSLAEDKDRFIAADQGRLVLESMLEIVDLIDSRCLRLDPIGVYDWMGSEKDAPAYSPFGYGYTNYSRTGNCDFPLIFANAPGFGDNGPRGTVIGGTGIAVSARSSHRKVATDYAFWIAGPDCQSGLFFESGGQPASAAAWENADCNAACTNFFSNTRKTLETSWLRPRYDGYMGFQDSGGDIIHACLRRDAGVSETLENLEKTYRNSRA